MRQPPPATTADPAPTNPPNANENCLLGGGVWRGPIAIPRGLTVALPYHYCNYHMAIGGSSYFKINGGWRRGNDYINGFCVSDCGTLSVEGTESAVQFWYVDAPPVPSTTADVASSPPPNANPNCTLTGKPWRGPILVPQGHSVTLPYHYCNYHTAVGGSSYFKINGGWRRGNDYINGFCVSSCGTLTVEGTESAVQVWYTETPTTPETIAPAAPAAPSGADPTCQSDSRVWNGPVLIPQGFALPLPNYYCNYYERVNGDSYFKLDGQWARDSLFANSYCGSNCGAHTISAEGSAVRFYYAAAVPLEPRLTLTLTAPPQLNRAGQLYAPNPFPVTASISNQGNTGATGVQVGLHLPAELLRQSGALTQTIGDLSPGETRQISWNVGAVLQSLAKQPTIAVRAIATNHVPVNAAQNIALPQFRYTTSYYEGSVDPLIHKQQGCQARKTGEQGIVVLDYGRPVNLGTETAPVWGAGLLWPHSDFEPDSVSIDEITRAVKAFADGYFNYQSCAASPINLVISEPVAPNLTIALGVTNTFIGKAPNRRSNPDLTKDHGIAWAEMVVQINQYFRDKGYTNMAAAGAYDAEPKWWAYGPNGKERTFDWAEGYNGASNGIPYYFFGSMDGGIRDASWLLADEDDPQFAEIFTRLDDIYELAMGYQAARPLPQIYNAAYAKFDFIHSVDETQKAGYA